jgi:hypothetical protein
VTDGARVAALVVVAALAIACRKNAGTAPPDAAAPDTTAAEEPAASADDPLGAPEQALADNAARLRELGVVLESDEEERKRTKTDDVPATEPTKPVPRDFESAATRCDELCGLADTACGLRVQICGLAQDHVGESRYEAACWRATDQCTRASAACDDCTTGRERDRGDKGGTAGAAGSCRPG